MKNLTRLPKILAILAWIVLSLLLFSVTAAYLVAEQPIVQDFLRNKSTDVIAATIAFKEVLLPFGVIILIPWLLNLLGILYMKRYVMASAVMLILSGLMMLYTIILPILLITAGTILITRHRYFIKHEKYQTPYQ